MKSDAHLASASERASERGVVLRRRAMCTTDILFADKCRVLSDVNRAYHRIQTRYGCVGSFLICAKCHVEGAVLCIRARCGISSAVIPPPHHTMPAGSRTTEPPSATDSM